MKNVPTLPVLLGACVLALGTIAVPEADARVVVGNVSEGAINELDNSRTGSLELKKVVGNPNDDVEEGNLPPASAEGAVFEIRRLLDIDLRQVEAWKGLDTLDIGVVDEMRLGEPRRAVADADGIARFEALEVGVYYVVEIPREVPGYSTPLAAPFLVTVPTGAVEGEGWDYDVRINPKNSSSSDRETPPPPGETPKTSSVPTPSLTTYLQTPPPGNDTEPKGPPSTGTVHAPPKSDSGFGSLARTGANVLGFVLLALVLIGIGLLLLRKTNGAGQE